MKTVIPFITCTLAIPFFLHTLHSFNDHNIKWTNRWKNFTPYHQQYTHQEKQLPAIKSTDMALNLNDHHTTTVILLKSVAHLPLKYPSDPQNMELTTTAILLYYKS